MGESEKSRNRATASEMIWRESPRFEPKATRANTVDGFWLDGAINFQTILDHSANLPQRIQYAKRDDVEAFPPAKNNAKAKDASKARNLSRPRS
jgi:hypothetical protein